MLPALHIEAGCNLYGMASECLLIGCIGVGCHLGCSGRGEIHLIIRTSRQFCIVCKSAAPEIPQGNITAGLVDVPVSCGVGKLAPEVYKIPYMECGCNLGILVGLPACVVGGIVQIPRYVSEVCSGSPFICICSVWEIGSPTPHIIERVLICVW